MRRRELRRRMRGLVIAVLMVLAFLSGFFGRTLVSAYAEEEYIKPVKRYYTSIQLQAGDSLWDIAEEYMDGSGYSEKGICRGFEANEWTEQRQNSCRSVFDCGLFCRIAERREMRSPVRLAGGHRFSEFCCFLFPIVGLPVWHSSCGRV